MSARLFSTPFSERFGLCLPLVQAPMVGATTTAMVAAASNAGALGSLGAAAFAPERLATEVEAIRAATDRPFAINLFVLPDATPDAATVARALAAIDPLNAVLGLPPGTARALRARLPRAARCACGAARARCELHVRRARCGRRRAPEGGRHLRDRHGDARGRGPRLAGGRRRCAVRAGRRGGWPSRHVHRFRRRCADRYARARAATGRRDRPARARRGRHHGRPRDRGRLRSARRARSSAPHSSPARKVRSRRTGRRACSRAPTRRRRSRARSPAATRAGCATR